MKTVISVTRVTGTLFLKRNVVVYFFVCKFSTSVQLHMQNFIHLLCTGVEAEISGVYLVDIPLLYSI